MVEGGGEREISWRCARPHKRPARPPPSVPILSPSHSAPQVPHVVASPPDPFQGKSSCRVGRCSVGGFAKSKGDTATLALPPVSNLRDEPRQRASGRVQGQPPSPSPAGRPGAFSAVDEASIIAHHREEGPLAGGRTMSESLSAFIETRRSRSV